jgi:ketosteroid isomerase-like protein
MVQWDPHAIVLRFNECINDRDIHGLADLMSDDHIFIDAANNKIGGKSKCLGAWQQFFLMFPDYRNIFKNVMVREDTMIIEGHSTCSDKRLDGPALWQAKVGHGKILEWRVYADTTENRRSLLLPN